VAIQDIYEAKNNIDKAKDNIVFGWGKASQLNCGLEVELRFRSGSYLQITSRLQPCIGRESVAYAAFGWPRSTAKVLFSQNPPRIFCGVLSGLERRVWFGSNNLKNRYTYEVLVLARKNSTAA
jgi:hypothetical protein